MSKKGMRVEEVIVQAVLTEYDDLDRPIRRIVTDPASIFRANTPDVWKELDARLKNSINAEKKQNPLPSRKRG